MYNDFRRYSLRFFFTLLLGLCILHATIHPAFSADNSRYNVYTPQTYTQADMEISPKYSRLYGEGIELLIDCSGSMTFWIKQVASTINYILPKIPENTYVALRLFGEKTYSPNSPFQIKEACSATRLITYFQKANQAKIKQGLQNANIGGLTPIEYALKQSIENDFKNMTVVSRGNPTGKRKKIILITDGEDTCGGNPCAYIREILYKNKDLQIDVIKVGSKNELVCLTNSTGGDFYTISGSDEVNEFEQALEKAFKVPAGTIEQGRKIDPTGSKIIQPTEQQTGVHPHTPTPQPDGKPVRGYKFIQF